ncbi:hypothetical protein Ciccas_013957 [Cichlidogyrus casuarinus]|uniref:Uncharacterized protein n=1 Tax=Cichlidogyrus casuarinus TaxID=1844966 RepID=A0ABD2PM84_9PLAT
MRPSVSNVDQEELPGLNLLAPNLISLDVSNNRIEPFGLPKDYPKQLAYCDMANNRITHVGIADNAKLKDAGKLEFLLQLNLRSNKLKSFQPVNQLLPEDIHDTITALEQSPKSPDGHTGVKTGVTATDQERKLRISCLWFPKLTNLDLSCNLDLTLIGNEISFMSRLNCLELENCTLLSELPPALWQLDQLRILTINGTLVHQHLTSLLGVQEPELSQPKKKPFEKAESKTDFSGLHTKAILSYLKTVSNKSVSVLIDPTCQSKYPGRGSSAN